MRHRNMKIKLSKTKTDKYDLILLKKNGINDEVKSGKLSKEEKTELKSYAIKKAVKIKKYVRN